MVQAGERFRSADSLEDLMGYNLKRAYVVVQKNFCAALGYGEMSGGVFAALSFICEKPGITQSDLARMLGVERSGLVAIIDELEGRGFVRRIVVPEDRRVQALEPTAAGARARADAMTRVHAQENRLLSFLSKDEKAQLMHLLHKIRHACEGEPK